MECKTFTIKNRRYLGNKFKLIPFIKGVVDTECEGIESVADIFAGTGSVASAFTDKKLITNDNMYSSYICHVAWFHPQQYDYDKLAEMIAVYNATFIEEENYMSENFADTYFSAEDCRKIGFIREDIEEKYQKRSLPVAQVSQWVLKQLNQNWTSFFKQLKDFAKNPSKYKGRPKIPNYLDKDGRYMFSLTNQNCKLKDGYILFPKSFNGFKLTTKVDNLKQVRVIPKGDYYQIEVIYEVKEQLLKEDNNRYFSVDLGVNNLAAITNNFNGEQWLISGKPIKSINQYYNKLKADYQSKAILHNGKHITNRILRLTNKRNDRINTYLHKASKLLIDLAVSYDVSKIVIGYNKNWKQEVDIGKRNNQNFVGIPFLTFVNYIIYKAKLNGIDVILTEESYTSGTSFLDNELPIKENYNKSRRVYRGLFKTKDGKQLNSDINGSYQILKKVIGNYYVEPVSLKVLQVI